MANRINFQVGFQEDSATLSKIKKDLQEIQQMARDVDFTSGLNPRELQSMTEAAHALDAALEAAFDVDLNTINVQKFNNILRQTGLDIKDIQQGLAYAGTTGQSAFLNATAGLMQFNTAAKQTNQFLNNIATSFSNTIRWGIMSSIVNNISGTIQKSYYYVKDLDSALNDIRIVTGKNADEMERFATQANNAAKQLAVTTKDYTQGSLIYYQQGLDDETVKTLTDITAMTSNVTQQSMSTVSEQLTAVWNGYQVANQAAQEGMQVYEEYVDKMAAVGAATASDLEELSTAMSKVAAAASAMGVNFDDLNAQIATIVSVTRQAPESVGTALKTIYARLGDLKVDGVDEFGTKLGEVSSQLETMGVSILDSKGDMRDMSDVIGEVAEKWQTWTSAQKEAAAVAMAGKRQYNNLVALFDNWDMYEDTLETSIGAQGTLQKQQEIALDSLANKLEIMQAAAEDVYDSLFDEEHLKGFVDAGTGVLNFLTDAIDGVGGLDTILMMLGGTATRVFSEQIASGLATLTYNLQNSRDEAAMMESNFQQLQAMFSDSSFVMNSSGATSIAVVSGLEDLKDYYNDMSKYQSIMNKEEKEHYNNIIKQKVAVGETGIELENQLDNWKTLNQNSKIFSANLKNINDAEGFDNLHNQVTNFTKAITDFRTSTEDLNINSIEIEEPFARLIGTLESNGIEVDNIKTRFFELRNSEEDSSIALSEFIEYLSELGAPVAELDALKQKFDILGEASKNAGDKMRAAMELKQAYSNIMQTVGAIGQLASGLMTLSNLKNIIENDDLSTWEKTLQIVTNLTMSTTMLVGAFQGLSTAGPQVVNSLKIVLTSLLGLTTAEGGAATAADIMWTSILWPIALVVAGIAGVTAGIYLMVKAWNADKEAAKTDAEEVKNVTERYEELTSTVREFKQEVSEYDDAIKALEELEKGTDEYAEAVKKANEEAQKLIETYELWGKYSKKDGLIVLDDGVLENLQALQESQARSVQQNMYGAQIQANNSQVKSDTTDLTRNIGLIIGTSDMGDGQTYYEDRYFTQDELEAAASAIQDFKEANENAEMSVENLLSMEDELPDAITANTQAIIDHQGEILTWKESLDSAASANEYYAERILGLSVEKLYGDKIRAMATDEEGNTDEALVNQITDAMTSRISEYEDQQGQAIADIDTSNVTSNAKLREYDKYSNIKNDEDLARAYARDVMGIDEKDIGEYKGGVNKGSIYDKEGNAVFEKRSDDVMRKALARVAEEEAIIEQLEAEMNEANSSSAIVEQALHSLTDAGNAFSELYDTNFVTPLLDAIANGDNKIDFSSIFSQLSPDQIATLSSMSEEELKQAFGLDDAAIMALGWEIGEEGGNSFKDAWDAALDEYDSTAWIEKVKGMVSSANEEAKTLMEGLQAGDIDPLNIAEDEGYQNLMDQMNSLVDIYPELTAEAGILNQTWLAGTQEYIETLEKVQDKLYELDLQSAIDDASVAIDNLFDKFGDEEQITVDADTEGFEDAMQEILNAEYAIDVKIHTEAEQEFNSITSAFDELETMASKIGDDFIVAADDVRALNNAFPGILESMEIVGDGTVKLNEQIVQSAMQSAEAEAQADAQATIDKLNNQATLLRTKQTIYEQMANAALILAESETGSEEGAAEARETISKSLAEIKKLDSQNTANSEMNNDVEVANSSNVNGQIVARNWASAFSSMAESSYNAARIAINNMNAVANGGGALEGGGSINAQYNGSSGQTSEASILEATEAALESATNANAEKWAELAQQYAGLADAAGSAANDIEGMIAQIGASGTSLDKALGGVSSGLGSDGKKDKSGSGKGSKEKERTPKDEKNFEDEFDRYWQIKKAIDSVDRAIKKLNKDQENLYGYELINSLKQENKLLEQQAANYNALYTAQQQEAAELRSQLGTMGVMFDASGAITNYAAATASALAAYNAAIQQYNAGLIDETTLGVYEKAYENFKKLLDRYDQLYYTEMKDTQEKLEDIQREIKANNLKAWEVEIEVKLDLREAERGWAKFLKEINEDFTKVYQDLRADMNELKKESKTYLGKDGTIGVDIKAIHDVVAEIDKMKAGGSSDMFESISQAQEKLKELNQQLQDDAKNMHDLWKQAWDTYLDGIDQVADKFDDLMDQFEYINDELEFQGELIDLLYGEKAYGLLDTLYKGQEKSLENQIGSVKQQVDMWKKLWEESGATMDNQADWTEDQRKYYEEWMEAQGDLNDLVIEYIKLLKEDYLNTVDQVLDSLEKSLTGSSLKDIQTEWERISADADKYLDSVEGAYEIQKLANKIDESISSTSNLKNQQKLQALRDKEIKYLREKENLTQYDLDAAEARYQIALKEMALEDARNNKTAMKLVRNEQGNWSYQYLADENEVMSKQQELLDAYNNLYQLASDAYEANLEALQDLQEKYLESAREIYTDETLSEEEKEQKLLELREWYFEQYALLAEENTLYREDLASSAAALLLEIYNQDEEAYRYMTDSERAMVDALVSANIEDYQDLRDKMKENYKDIGDASKTLMEDTRKDWTSSAQELATRWIEASGQIRKDVLDSHAQIQKATEEYKKKVDWCAEAVERNFSEQGITGAINKAADATDNLKDKTEDLVNDGVSYLEELRRAVDEIADAWRSVQAEIEAAISLLQQYMSEMAAANSGGSGGGDAGAGGGGGGVPGGGGGDGGGGNRSYSDADVEGIAGNIWVYGSWGNNPTRHALMKQKFGSNGDALYNAVQAKFNSGYGYNGGLQHDYDYYRSFGPDAYDTGGYTGTWDSSGRLALLHQKELVLNADDTKNFLSGISMLRDMTSLNGSINNAILSAIGGMAMRLGNVNSGVVSGGSTSESTIGGDTFYVTAEFPNANDVNDIREALLSLPNLASQYVNRNQK